MLRQYLPLAEARDVLYEFVDWWTRGEDFKWRPTNLQNSAFVEITIPSYEFVSLTFLYDYFIVKCIIFLYFVSWFNAF